MRAGDLVAVVGEQASGKTTLLCDWMARISTGAPFPGDPAHFRREPGEVLLFNSGDSFADTIQPRLLLGGGDLGRISLVTRDLQTWSGKPSELPAGWQSFDPSAYNSSDRRSELHRKGPQKWLANFLKNRPRIQMVVIDHVWHHMRADMERYFTPTIAELTHIARESNVVIVLSMHPNAYRNDVGPAEFLKSRELLGSARSIWRTVRPTDLSIEARSLQCLKLSQFPNIPGAEDPWGLFWGPRGELEWVPGAAPRYSHTKKAKEERWMWHAMKFLRQHLGRAGGVAEFHTLLLAARNLKIPQTWFMQAILTPEFEIDYEPVGEDELIQVIGTPQAMAQRRADPNPPALKINCPPGAAESTDDDPDFIESIKNLRAAEKRPPDPTPHYGAGLPGTFPGDKPAPAEGAQHEPPPAEPKPNINLRQATRGEVVEAGYTRAEGATAQRYLNTPPGWVATPDWRDFLEQKLTEGLAQFGTQLPEDVSARAVVNAFLAGHLGEQPLDGEWPDPHAAAEPVDDAGEREPRSAVGTPMTMPPLARRTAPGADGPLDWGRDPGMNSGADCGPNFPLDAAPDCAPVSPAQTPEVRGDQSAETPAPADAAASPPQPSPTQPSPPQSSPSQPSPPQTPPTKKSRPRSAGRKKLSKRRAQKGPAWPAEAQPSPPSAAQPWGDRSGAAQTDCTGSRRDPTAPRLANPPPAADTRRNTFWPPDAPLTGPFSAGPVSSGCMSSDCVSPNPSSPDDNPSHPAAHSRPPNSVAPPAFPSKTDARGAPPGPSTVARRQLPSADPGRAQGARGEPRDEAGFPPTS
jgi:hypothetical protein